MYISLRISLCDLLFSFYSFSIYSSTGVGWGLEYNDSISKQMDKPHILKGPPIEWLLVDSDTNHYYLPIDARIKTTKVCLYTQQYIRTVLIYGLIYKPDQLLPSDSNINPLLCTVYLYNKYKLHQSLTIASSMNGINVYL